MSHSESSNALLPKDYKPSPYSVIVGRGQAPKKNLGNQRLRQLATAVVTKYQQGDKKCKTRIVSEIIGMIRDACKDGRGAFVKYSKKTNRWYDLDDSVAREKVGYVFRDLLADEYKSSSKSKVARRNHVIANDLSFLPTALMGGYHSEQDSAIISDDETVSSSSSLSDSIRSERSFQSIEECNSSQKQYLASTELFFSTPFSTTTNQCESLLRLPLIDEIQEYEDIEYLMRLPLIDASL